MCCLCSFPAAQNEHITRPCLSYWPAALESCPAEEVIVFLSGFSFFFPPTFLPEYHTVAQAMPSIIQTVCPVKLSFACCVAEHFSRHHILFIQKDRSGYSKEIWTHFFLFLCHKHSETSNSVHIFCVFIVYHIALSREKILQKMHSILIMFNHCLDYFPIFSLLVIIFIRIQAMNIRAYMRKQLTLQIKALIYFWFIIKKRFNISFKWC